MLVEGSKPPEECDIQTETDDRELAISRFKATHPGARVERIDGEDVIGTCEECGQPVLDSEDHQGQGRISLICPTCGSGTGDTP